MNLFKQRTYSQKFNVAFEWLRRYWRPMLKFVTFFLLPVCLVQPLGLLHILDTISAAVDLGTESLYDSIHMGDMVLLSVSLLLSILGGILTLALFYSMMKVTLIDGRDLNAFSISDMWSALRARLGRAVILFMLVVMGMVLGLGWIYSFIRVFSEDLGLLLSLLSLFPLVILMLPVAPQYMLTNEGLFSSIRKGCRIGWYCWWGVFSTAAVMLIMANALSGFANIPLQLFLGIKMAMLGQLAGTGELVLSFFTFLGLVVSAYVGYLSQLLIVVILTVQYGHATDKLDGLTLENEIDKF